MVYASSSSCLCEFDFSALPEKPEKFVLLAWRGNQLSERQKKLGFGPETVRGWFNPAELNAGVHPRVSESDNVEIRPLRKESQ